MKNFYNHCLMCGTQKPKSEKVGKKYRDMTTRKYCTTCKPITQSLAKKPKKSLKERVAEGEKKECSVCKKSKCLSEFLTKDELYIKTSKCVNCFAINSRKIQKSFKDKMKYEFVSLKGGKCLVCGYNKSLRALEFHHIDPREKDFILSDLRSYEESLKELEKCVLLCANCHREIHGNFIKIEDYLNE